MQKEAQRVEQENIELSKERIKRIANKQSEREKLLNLHEQEIKQLREKLKEKEELIYKKTKTVSSIENQSNSVYSIESLRLSPQDDMLSND